MEYKLPSRYEDLDDAFKGRLKPNIELNGVIKESIKSIKIGGGLRFIPIFGLSGSGKSSAALELSSHLPDICTEKLSRTAIENSDELREIIGNDIDIDTPTVLVIDQFEENAPSKKDLPGQFIETISIIDREKSLIGDKVVIFIWLTTDKKFRDDLIQKTTRNSRIIEHKNVEIVGPDKGEWPSIISETFRFHNSESDLSDYEILEEDLNIATRNNDTLGDAIIEISKKLFDYIENTHDLSEYRVIMLWPVTDGLRITRIAQFAEPRQGYTINWSSWFRQLNISDQKQLPLKEYNRARLYFDMKIVPIAVADIKPFCREIDKDSVPFFKSYLERFEKTHFVKILKGEFSEQNYAPLRERPSARSDEAKEWYSTVTTKPTKIGKRIAQALSELGINAVSEKTIESPYGRIRADVYVDNKTVRYIIEMKCFSAENTMPSTICDAIRTTMKRHAQFAGFVSRQ